MVTEPALIPVTVPLDTVATEELLVLHTREGDAVTEVGLPSRYFLLRSVVVQLAVPPTKILEGLKVRLLGSRRQVSVGVYVTSMLPVAVR